MVSFLSIWLNKFTYLLSVLAGTFPFNNIFLSLFSFTITLKTLKMSALTLFLTTTTLRSITRQPQIMLQTRHTLIGKRFLQHNIGTGARRLALNWHNQPVEKDATLNGRKICIAQLHQESESWTLVKSRAKLVVLMEYKIKGKKASTAGVLVNPVKVSKNFDEIELNLTFLT